MTPFGFSRDDIGSFMPAYIEQKNPRESDPFQTLDVKGVGQLVEIGVTKGRQARREKHNEHLKIGICGEHGGDPDSVAFCHRVGMDYVLRARRSACRSPGWPRPRPPSPTASRSAAINDRGSKGASDRARSPRIVDRPR